MIVNVIDTKFCYRITLLQRKEEKGVFKSYVPGAFWPLYFESFLKANTLYCAAHVQLQSLVLAMDNGSKNQRRYSNYYYQPVDYVLTITKEFQYSDPWLILKFHCY